MVRALKLSSFDKQKIVLKQRGSYPLRLVRAVSACGGESPLTLNSEPPTVQHSLEIQYQWGATNRFS